MTITAFDGPVGTFPNTPAGSPSSVPGGQNPDAGPAFFNHGLQLLDPRLPYTYKPGQNFGAPVCGWLSASWVTIDQAPTAVTANNIAAAQTATTGVPLILAAANTTGVTVGVSIVRADTGATVTGLLALDSAMTTQKFGSSGSIQIWAPTTAISRNIRIIPSLDDSAGTFTVVGYDIYNFPMTEAIRGTNATTRAGKKAFKYIASITPSGTVNSTALTVGNGTAIGLPLRADVFPQVFGVFGNSTIIITTGFTAADTATPTTVTGDVRGTYVPQTAPDGSLRLTLYQSVSPSNIGTASGIVGNTQA